MNDLDPEIAKLLRLKRYEQPPENYYEDFLLEFQRRQRVRSMRLSLWEKISLRFSELTEQIRIPAYAYAAVGACALVVSTWILADPSTQASPGASIAATAQKTIKQKPGFSLTSDAPSAFQTPVTIPSQRFVGTLPPQYLLHNSPVPENDPFRF